MHPISNQVWLKLKQIMYMIRDNTCGLQHERVHSMNSNSENVWCHSDTDTEEVNTYEEMMMKYIC